MSKNQDLGLDSSIVRGWMLRAFLEASVPLRAAVIEREGDLVWPKDGGAKRRRAPRTPFDLSFVGERPAAAGAEAGVVEGLVMVLRRGVAVCGGRRGLVDGIVVKLKCCGFRMETLASADEYLRFLMESKMFGLTFSESDSSGEAWRRFNDGAELGAMAGNGC